MGGACSTHIKYKILVGKPEGKRPLRRPTRRWEYNIKGKGKVVSMLF
jgi:hypothetical protein